MTYSEFILFSKKISFKKAFNAVVLYTGYISSVIFKSSNRRSYPVSLSIEPTSVCNLKCPECPTGMGEISRFKGNIPYNTYKKILDETSPYLLNLILYFQGEPYMNKDIFKLITYASLEKKVYTTSSTNGHFLSSENALKTIESGLDRLIISIDGTTQEIYESYRKSGNLEQVKEGIRNLVSLKENMQSKTPYIVIQFLVLKTNEHQIEDIKKLTKEIGADKLELKSAQIYDFENNTSLIPNNEKYSRYRKTDSGKYEIKSRLKNKCLRLWETSVITNTGEVLPCCFDKDADFSFGNINNKSFKSINKDVKAKQFRKKLLTSRKQIEICRNCTEGLKK